MTGSVKWEVPHKIMLSPNSTNIENAIEFEAHFVWECPVDNSIGDKVGGS